MKQTYKHPRIEVAEMRPQQMICASAGSDGWAEMGGYGGNTGGGFIQEEP